MAEKLQAEVRCTSCGTVSPAGTLVCPECHAILAKPAGKARTPAWFIVLLIIVVAALLAYAGYLAWDQLVQHNYAPSPLQQ